MVTHRLVPRSGQDQFQFNRRKLGLAGISLVTAFVLSSHSAFAQEEAAEDAGEETVQPAAPAEDALAPEGPDAEAPTEEPLAEEVEPTNEAAPISAEDPATQDEPAEPEAFKPSLKVGMGIRTGAAMVFNDTAAGGAYLRLDDGVGGQLYNVRPYFSGQLTENIGLTGNFEATSGGIAPLDMIIQVKVVDEFQVWVGQHIPAMERNNFNGPFYNNGWNLPIVVQTLPFDIAGRDRGITAWGLVAGGFLKYHLSVVDLETVADTVATEAGGIGSPRYAGRVTLNFLDKENYYYTSGTYYGEQDTLAIGAVLHGQQGVDAPDGTDLDNDLLAFTADLLFEKNLGKGGTITLEGGYWNLEGVGADYLPNQGTTRAGVGVVGPLGGSSYLASISWLTPEKVGFGKLQPLAKVQIGDYADTVVAVDAGLGYIVDGFNHRWFVNFRHQDNGNGTDEQMVQIGGQLQL